MPELAPPIEFEPVDPPAPMTALATTPTFDADAPLFWRDNPACNTRYAHAETLHLRLPDSVDIDAERLHALREFSSHTLVWTPDAGRHLVKAPVAGTRSRVRWRLQPDAPVEVWVIDASPSPADPEACWDAVNVRGTVELESADGSLAITKALGHLQLLQLTPNATRVRFSSPAARFGLDLTATTLDLDPSMALQLDLPVASPRGPARARMDSRGLTPIEVQLTVTIDKWVVLGGERRQLQGLEFLAVSEESPEARALLGQPPD
jgi:hypothetical protein